MTRHRLIPTAIALAALAAPSVASAADRDHDNMRDSWEKRFGLSTKKKNGNKDRDRDGLKNLHEYRSGMNPRDRDSDDDGRRDGREGAGKIKSFDAETGVLVIDRFRGDDLTGKVDSSTEIECEDHSRRHHNGDDDGPNDTSGNGTPEDGPGDTRGDGTPEDNKVLAKSDDDDDDRSGSNSGPGSGDDRRGEDDDRCGAENLKAGRIVKEAELHTGDDGPHDVFDEIEVLVRK